MILWPPRLDSHWLTPCFSIAGRSSRPTVQRCMTRRSNKDNLVEHPEIDKLEKHLGSKKPKRWPTKQLALTPLKWRANEEGRDPPPPS
ncbi:unnamed protein product [Microthlaspi erraticum]|uniref:Uncharacterized protein n=1 Tax=Microthlaspi erraticum TaxID=1685480 RepID=A0A6D2JYU3_9BRAS|nr:unnamed protein product [Microthlaspi erraticum]